MRISEIPVTLWNGKFLDGVLTITTTELFDLDDIENNAERNVTITLLPQSADMSYIAVTKMNATPDSINEALNSVMYEYTDLVVIFKNRELESGTISLH